MSRDRREQLAARSVALLGDTGLVDAARVFRNRVDVDGRMGPTIVLWDGDEGEFVSPSGSSRGPSMIELTPVVRICAEARAEDIGGQLNAIRLAVIKKLTQDGNPGGITPPGAGTLAEIYGSNGRCKYLGCTQSLERGSKIEGELWLHFQILYPLLDEEL